MKLLKNTHQGLKLAIALAIGISFLAPRAEAINLQFSSIAGAVVEFDGSANTFSFLPSTGDQFQITLSDGVGDSLGLQGNMSGDFTIGAITSVGSLQIASVTGSGVLTIDDGFGGSLTANLSWNNIATYGTGGFINVGGSMNLQSISYSGSNADLTALAAPLQGSEVVSFQFIPGRSLTYLTTDGNITSATFSGSIAAEDIPGGGGDPVPDNGATLMLLGLAFLGMVLVGGRKMLTTH